MQPLLYELRVHLRATPLRAPWVWARHIGLIESDVYLACYPRSGSTWLQFMLYEVLTGEEAQFETVLSASPYIGKHHRAPRLLPHGRRLIKTHEPYRPAYRKALLLVRDPRDVVLSDFRYLCMRDDYHKGFETFLADFVRGRTHGFGSWGHHTASWLESGMIEAGNACLLRFEDMRRDPEQALRKALGFLGVPAEGRVIRQAVRRNAVSAMRKKEDEAGRLIKKARRGLRFVSKGEVGLWTDHLSPEQSLLIEDAFGDLMVELGYPVPGSGDRRGRD